MQNVLSKSVTGLNLALCALVIVVVFYVSVFGVFRESYLRVGMLLVGGLLILLAQIEGSQSLIGKLLALITAALLSVVVYQYFRAAAEIETGL
ncbi:hypothetical protein [Primorskyibacter sp. S187A]|uniref:hypothetical protein n=1 Tax=Primorskyibacter sp. S187A TaxID=3415130 RepID=UPI003C7E5EEA